jgi:hypothetical protein
MKISDISMKKLLASLLLVEAALFASPAQSESAPKLPASSGDYFQDLGAITGAIRTLDVTESTCMEALPKATKRYRAIYDNWKKRNDSFVTEMRNDFESLPKFWASMDAKSAKFSLQNWPVIQKSLKMSDDNARQQLLAQDKAHLIATCDAVTKSVADPKWDMDRYFANLLPTIRRGPPVPVAQANPNAPTAVPMLTTSPANPGEAAPSSAPAEK